jgi:hypothetical protein
MAIEQRAPIEPFRTSESPVRPVGGESFEFEHVDRKRAGLQSYALALRHQYRGAVFLQSMAQGREGLAERALGLRFRPVAPKQADKLIPRAGFPRGEGQIGQQRFRLARR